MKLGIATCELRTAERKGPKDMKPSPIVVSVDFKPEKLDVLVALREFRVAHFQEAC